MSTTPSDSAMTAERIAKDCTYLRKYADDKAQQGYSGLATRHREVAATIERLTADLARVERERDELNRLGYDINAKWRLEQQDNDALKTSLANEIERAIAAESEAATLRAELAALEAAATNANTKRGAQRDLTLDRAIIHARNSIRALAVMTPSTGEKNG